MNEKLLRLYNTDIVGSYKFKLLGLGYIPIFKLNLAKAEQEYLIRVAREERNNLALTDAHPMAVCVKQSFYNEFVIKNFVEQNSLNVNIKSEDQDFINKLVQFLAKNSNVNFTMTLLPGSERDCLEKEKIDFLSSNISDIDFNTRAMNCLKNYGIQYVYQIAEYGKQISKIMYLGDGTLSNIKFEFTKRGLNLYKIPGKLINTARHRCEVKTIA